MKYKHTRSAIHNFGHSFVSDMNRVDSDLIIHDLKKIHRKSFDIEIDWMTGKFEPNKLATDRIAQSIKNYRSYLPDRLSYQNVELAKLNSLTFTWLADSEQQLMSAIDDRGKQCKIAIVKTL